MVKRYIKLQDIRVQPSDSMHKTFPYDYAQAGIARFG